MNTWVVKLGGSLFTSKYLKDWLSAVAEKSSVVVVPGGGPFADQVRVAQARWRFDDVTAHAMAIDAMRQYGRMLCSLEPRLQRASSVTACRQLLATEQAVVWLPDPDELDHAGLSASWNVTSDSIAAWLAAQLNANVLGLVKSVTDLQGCVRLADALDAGWLDASFPKCWSRQIPAVLFGAQATAIDLANGAMIQD